MTQRQTDVNGWFEVKRNPLSRVGVFPYRGASVGLQGAAADSIVRVYRPEEELSDPECLESFKLVPWVDEHTMLGPDESTTPAEVKGVQGVIGEEVFYDSGVLYGNIKAFSNSLTRLIEAGKKQLSAGYRCVYDWTAGTFQGQPYDCVQRQIRGNHVALVQEGRMGPSVAVLDSMQFTFDAQEAIPMADPKDTNAGGEAGSMTLAQVVETLGQIAPQVAALTAAMAKLGTPAPATAAATPDGAVPPAAKPAATPVEAAGATAGMTEDKLAAAMDGALKPIRDELGRLGGLIAAAPATVATDSAARDKLADRLAAHVGTFDAKDKTLQAVAVYGAEKLGLKPPAGSELVAVDAYLTAADKLAKPATVTTGAGLDAATGSAPAFVTRHLSGAAVK